MGAARARELARWRSKVVPAWPGLKVRLASMAPSAVDHGGSLLVAVDVALNGLSAGDLQVECVVGCQDALGEFVPTGSVMLECPGGGPQGEARYQADLCAPHPRHHFAGLQHYQIRVYPYNSLLSHRFECGLMLWL